MKPTAWLTRLPKGTLPVIAGLFLTAVLILSIAFWLWPSWRETHKLTQIEEQVRLQTELVKTSAQLVLGALVVATLYLTWKRVRAAERTVEVAQEGQITERFTRAVEQLGNQDSMAVRLGGIYALERIARDSKRDHWQVMEVLTAFARDSSPYREDKPSFQPLAADIQAVLTVLGRRNFRYDRKGLRLDLSETHLLGARLMESNLEHVMFTGANLQNAAFFRVKFRGAIFHNANLIVTNFQKSNLEQCEFHRALMHGTKLEGSNIANSDLSEAQHLTREQIEAAIGAGSAQLPTWLHDTPDPQSET